MSNTDIAALETLIERLLEQHRAGEQTHDPLEALHNLTTLTLAQAALRQARLLHDKASALGPQVVVLGPTQAGKSSLINRLLGAEQAGVSALAGHTVHLHGFTNTPSPDAAQPTGATSVPDQSPDSSPPSDRRRLSELLAPLSRVEAAALDRSRLDHYSLERVHAPSQRRADSPLARATLWDSPDFDSLESAGYRDAVLLGLSLADVVVLALSKDKYADRTVWTVLELLHALSKPVLIVLNKLDMADEATLVRSIAQRHQAHFDAPAPPIHTIAFSRGGMSHEPDSALIEAVNSLLSTVHRSRREAEALALARRFWTPWTARLRLELAAEQLWEQQVAAAVARADTAYSERYLHDSAHYDTFNRALLALLELLEIPGLAKVLGRTRQVVTWPVRQVFRWGQARVTGQRQERKALNIEQQILEDIGAEQLTELQAAALDAAETTHETRTYWQAVYQRLRHERASLLQGYAARALQGQAEFAPRIEAAAQRLHAQLQQTPAVLNTLRAARVSADTAGVALAVKSGGVPAADLVLAPAMLSLTSLLTESALGRYLDTVRSELQAEQREQRRRSLFEGFLAGQLHAIGHQAHTGSSVPISATELSSMEQWLFSDRQGLIDPSGTPT